MLVRVKDFVGVQPEEAKGDGRSPKNTVYFEKPGRNRRFSVTMQCRFKVGRDGVRSRRSEVETE